MAVREVRRTAPRGRGQAELLEAVAPQLIAAEGFAGAVQELAVAMLLGSEGTTDCDAMEKRVHAAIIAEGWSAAGEPPSVHEVAGFSWGAIRLALALQLAAYEYEYDRESHRSRRELTLAAGREALRLALRSRAVD